MSPPAGSAPPASGLRNHAVPFEPPRSPDISNACFCTVQLPLPHRLQHVMYSGFSQRSCDSQHPLSLCYLLYLLPLSFNLARMCWFWAFTPHIKLCQDSRIFRSRRRNINKSGCSLILQINHYATGINTGVLEIGVTFGTGFYRIATHGVSKVTVTLYRPGAGSLKSIHLPAQCDNT